MLIEPAASVRTAARVPRPRRRPPEPEGAPKHVVAVTDEPPKDAPCGKPYQEGRYDEAIACWRADYAKTKDPRDILYAARAYQLGANLERSVELYGLFTRVADAGDVNVVVSRRIAVLREVISRRAGSLRR